MTVKMHTILCLSILIFFAGCNGDIFIDEYIPKGLSEITLTGTDNSKEIKFKSDKWSLNSVVCETNDSYTTTAYTIDGKETYLPFGEKELGSIHFTSDYMDVRVERKSGNKLTVTLNENLMNENIKMLIDVGNGIKYDQIEVDLAPTQKYQIESVVYDWDKFESYKGRLKEMQVILMDNNSSFPETRPVYPYKKSTYDINFTFPAEVWDEDIYSKLLGTPLPEITIPDVIDGKPILNDTKVAFGIRKQQLDTNLDKDMSVDVTIDPFDRRAVIVYNEMKSYYVPYKVYLSNPGTGKKLTVAGTLNIEEPVDFLIFKKIVDEN